MEENEENQIEQPQNVSQPLRLNVSRYPQLENVGLDRRTVRILKNLNAGRCSVLTQIATFVFQTYVVDENLYPQVLNALKEMIRVERIHYDLFANAIISFGGLPTYTNGLGDVWNGGFPNLSTNIRNILFCNIRLKECFIRKIGRLRSGVRNESLNLLFNSIIEDENLQIAELNRLVNEYVI